MSSQIHGHEVMHMILESGLTYSRTSLAAAIAGRFGPDARFHTCSAENMSAGELIEFLSARGKFSGPPEAFTLAPDRICRH
jgi:probable metal-binding protein